MAKDFEPTYEILLIMVKHGKLKQFMMIYLQPKIQLLRLLVQLDIFLFMGEGIILKLDFSDIFKRDCKSNLDYDIWNSKSIDGSQTKYCWKKENSECFNPKQMITKKIIETCPCKREDWICASGYASQLEGGDCLPIVNIIDQCEPETTYFKSQNSRFRFY